MAENRHQLKVVIGATLSNNFLSTVKGSTSVIQNFSVNVQNLSKQSMITGRSLERLKNQHNSALNAMNRQRAIVQKRDFYRSQIMGVAALGAALVAPMKSAMDFEDSLAGIKAVVDFENPESLQKLGDVFREMSRTIPVTADELANIAAVGGRFGALRPLEFLLFSKRVVFCLRRFGSSQRKSFQPWCAAYSLLADV